MNFGNKVKPVSYTHLKPYTQLSYPGIWSYPSLPDGTLDYENGKYLPSPEDYRNPEMCIRDSFPTPIFY